MLDGLGGGHPERRRTARAPVPGAARPPNQAGPRVPGRLARNRRRPLRATAAPLWAARAVPD